MTNIQYLISEDLRKFASPLADYHYPPSLPLEPFHQTIKIKFDLDEHSADAKIITTIRANAGDHRTITFNAIDLTIQKVSGPEHWDYNGKKIHMTWDTPFAKNEERTISIDYRIDDPISGMYFSTPNKAFPNRPRYIITDNESERARYWLPCIDHLAVRCSIDFYLTSSQDHTILANGKFLEKKKHSDGLKTVHWQQEFPCPSYLISIAVGDFISVEDESVDMGMGPIPVRYYTTKNFNSADLLRSFRDTPKFLKWMRDKWQCTLAWPKYYQIATFIHGGAMENISLVTWNDFAIMNEAESEEMQKFIDLVNVHEMAHSWFGDMIVCKEFAHAWLKESWAVYVEKLYVQDEWGEDEYIYQLYGDAKRYMAEVNEEYARPIVSHKYDSSWMMYDRHLYPGGAWRLHMLRQKLGDKVFLSAVRDYLNKFKGKVVETIDFRRIMEDHSGLNLEEWFQQWFYEKGYPKLKAEFSYDEEQHFGALKITQQQINEEFGIKLFKFPLKIRWETKEGVFQEKVYQIKEKIQTCYFPSKQKPLQIWIDPNYELLCALEYNPGQDMLKRQLSTGNLIMRIKAAQELGKTNKKSAIKAIHAAYSKEEFWGAKIEYAKTLARCHHVLIPTIFKQILHSEQDPLVLPELLAAMGKIRNSVIYDSLVDFLSKKKPNPYANRFALIAVGAQRTTKALEYLIQYDITQDFKSIIEGGKYIGIGRTRSLKAIDYLAQRLERGKVSEHARRAQIDGLCESLVWAPKDIKLRTIEQILDSLRWEDSEYFRKILIFNLVKLGDEMVIPTIKNSKSRLAIQDHPLINHLIHKIESVAEPEKTAKRLEEKYENLEKTLSKLQAKIEKLEANHNSVD